MKAICMPCQLFYKIEKSGIYFVENMPSCRGHWKPYKLWAGDKYKCPGCGSTIIIGIGRSPISEHYKPDFDVMVKHLNATFQVNDC